MYKHIYTCIHIHMYTCKYMGICMYIYIYIHIQNFMYTYTSIHNCMHIDVLRVRCFRLAGGRPPPVAASTPPNLGASEVSFKGPRGWCKVGLGLISHRGPSNFLSHFEVDIA